MFKSVIKRFIFRTLFTTPLTEIPQPDTFLVGIASKDLEIIINYAYLRDVASINATNVVEIMVVSDYLGVLGLLKYCIDFIIKTMSSDNCIIMWMMSR